MRQFSNIPKRALKGCNGAVATTSRESVKLLSTELKYISAHIKEKTGMKELDPGQFSVLSCNTNDVENDHSQTHHKTTTPTMLNYARDLATVMWEAVKRTSKWAAHYFISVSTYYPVK